MKKIIFSMLGIFLCVSSTQVQAAETTNSVPVTRVVKMCQETVSEINVSALEQAAQILKSSHPEIAGELEKMAKETKG